MAYANDEVISVQSLLALGGALEEFEKAAKELSLVINKEKRNTLRPLETVFLRKKRLR